MRSRRDGRETGESEEQVAVFLSVFAEESELQSKVAELIVSVDETLPEILYNETDQMVATVPCGRWRCMEARHQTRESESRMCNMFFLYIDEDGAFPGGVWWTLKPLHRSGNAQRHSSRVVFI